jgi:hypothetical protein
VNRKTISHGVILSDRCDQQTTLSFCITVTPHAVKHLALKQGARGDADGVEFFFDRVGGVDDVKDNILLYGAMLGHVEIVQAMIDRGADPRIGRDRALARAAMAGHVNVVEHLISTCDINTQRSKELLEMARKGGCDIVSTECSTQIPLVKRLLSHVLPTSALGKTVKTSQVYKAELQQIVDS